MLRISDKIPNLEAEAFYKGKTKKIRFADYSGKWLVVVFYPADFTFVCPTELGELADRYAEFKKLGAEIISVSTDTVFVHKAWHDTSPTIKKISYPMVADPNRKICRTFGTLIENDGISRRATFLFDPKGKLRWFEIHDNAIGRSTAEILRKLKAAQYVASHPGEVCPVSWEPGKKTLKPILELVGKI